MSMALTELDRKIINTYQGGVPICENPYAQMAQQLDIDETLLLERLAYMLDSGILSRFGPLYNIEKLGGAFCLAAMKVPSERYDAVVELVNGFQEVAHNYAREHKFNMWFVIATESRDSINDVAARIEKQCGSRVYLFPKLDEYFVELKLQA